MRGIFITIFLFASILGHLRLSAKEEGGAARCRQYFGSGARYDANLSRETMEGFHLIGKRESFSSKKSSLSEASVCTTTSSFETVKRLLMSKGVHFMATEKKDVKGPTPSQYQTVSGKTENGLSVILRTHYYDRVPKNWRGKTTVTFIKP
ncbi:MAG: hypothetical protein HYT76_06440 [Deltaproteobacteria bacterium]|nr:hypothetical protein [Deltaproteobacteria bacterium]